jgi:hypothetical protein
MPPGGIRTLRCGAIPLAMVCIAACGGPRRDLVLLPSMDQGCDTLQIDSTSPPPRMPVIGAIPRGHGALVGTVQDGQIATGLGRSVIRLSGRYGGWALTDSLGGFAFGDLPTGLYVVRAVRLRYRPVWLTARVDQGRATVVRVALQREVCGREWTER